jgi:hypothetical protein
MEAGGLQRRGGGNTGLSLLLRQKGQHGRHLLDDDVDYSDAETVADIEDEDNTMVLLVRKENKIV